MKTIIIVLIILTGTICTAQTLHISFLSDLNLGNIIPGGSKQVSESSPDAGKFVLKGDGSVFTAAVSFSFSRTLTGDRNDMPLLYTASYIKGTGSKTRGTPFDPYAGTILYFDGKNREYSINLGAILNATQIREAGRYTSPIIIIVNILSY